MIDFYDYAGKLAAGTLGYIAGGIPGAFVGYRAYNSLPKNMKRKGSVYKRTNNKKRRVGAGPYFRGGGPIGSVSKRNPRFKSRKPIVCKGVKIPRKLARQIKCVSLKAIHDEKPTGKYFKWSTGIIRKSITLGSEQTLEDRYDYTITTSGAYSHFSVGEYRKMIDAISVLWGVKAASFGFSTVNDLSPVQMTVPAFLHTQEIKFTNNSAVARQLVLYETTPKDDTNNSVRTNWGLMTLIQKGGITQTNSLVGMRPEMYPQFVDGYRILKKKNINIMPGKSYTYYLRQAVDHVKFENWMAQGSSTPTNFKKNFTKELLVIETAQIAGITGTSTTAVAWNTSTDNFRGCLAVFSKELISCKCPENIDNIASKDNTICVLNNVYAEVVDGSVNTIQSPALSVLPVYS